MSGYLAGPGGHNVAVRDGMILGRVAGCDIVVQDSKASRRHAKVIVDAGVVEIEDLGSSNGTLLNGKPVTRRVLRDGDEVQIGSHVLTYREGALPGAAPVATGGSGVAFDDDDELFGGGSAAPTAPPPARSAPAPAPPPPAPKPPVAPPSPAVPSAAPSAVPPSAVPSAGPPAGPPPRVVEFADEIVEVRKKEPAADKARAPAMTSAEPVRQQQRILQFQKKDAGGGVLGDDLAQMGGSLKLLVYAGVLAVGVGIAYGLIVLLR